MRQLRHVGLAVLMAAATASSAFAQRTVRTSNAPAGTGGFWEFGVDVAMLDFGLDNPSTTSFGFGSGTARAGKFISDVLSIEPQLNLGYFSTSGFSSNFLGILVGVLYHLQTDRTMPQWYARPFAMFNRSSATSGGTTTSTNRVGLGAGFGMKRPSKKNNRFTWRAEVYYQNLFKSGATPASSDLIVSGGVSVFTK